MFLTQPPDYTIREGGEPKIPVQVRYNDFASLKWQVEVGGRIVSAGITGLGNNNVLTGTLSWTSSVQLSDAGPYRVMVTDSGGTATSVTRTLTVTPAGPLITKQPESQSVIVGSDVTFSIGASGSGVLRYEWYKSVYAIFGQTGPALKLSNVQPSDAGEYQVTVYDSNGGRSSNRVTLTVNASSPPVITTQPASQNVEVNGTVTFSVGVSGGAPFQYQWYREGQAMVGATDASFTITGTAVASAGTYHVTVKNSLATVRSVDATLVVRVIPPVITVAPASQSAAFGSNVTFAVVATGSQPLTYKWYRNAEDYVYYTNPTLVLTGIGANAIGSYRVEVSNAAGIATASAILSVVNPARLVNLSLLTELPAGEAFTLGFVTSGGTKPLLFRAVGPSLSSFGVTSPHPDPRLELYASSTKVGDNDNWGDDPLSRPTLFSSVGAFPLTLPDSKDAALFGPAVAVGNNSVRISGSATTSGTVLAELYETTPASQITQSTPKLVNVSVLKPLGSGLSVGFVIGGAGARRLVIRAVGPGLARFGLPDAAGDPTLRVTTAAGALFGANDNWSALNSATMVAAGGFPLTINSRDAVFIGNFPPGSYVVQVSAVANSANPTGSVLVEVYDSFADVSMTP